METNNETNNANEHNMVKNPNWQEADQLAIYKRGRGVELGSTEKQLQLSGLSNRQTELGPWRCRTFNLVLHMISTVNPVAYNIPVQLYLCL